MKTRGCVFEGQRFWSPPGAAAPPLSLPDVSRYGNDGVFGAGAAAPTWEQLPSGLWVLSFDGGDDVVITANANACSVNPITFICWFRQSEVIIANSRKGFSSVPGWYIDVRNNYEMRIETSAGTSRFQLDNFNLTSLVFQFFAFSYDNVTNTFAYYQNGEVGAWTQLGAVPTGDIFYSAGEFFYLGNNNGLVGFFPGIVWPFGLFNYVLSHDEINRHFEAERHWFGR